LRACAVLAIFKPCLYKLQNTISEKFCGLARLRSKLAKTQDFT